MRLPTGEDFVGLVSLFSDQLIQARNQACLDFETRRAVDRLDPADDPFADTRCPGEGGGQDTLPLANLSQSVSLADRHRLPRSMKAASRQRPRGWGAPSSTVALETGSNQTGAPAATAGSTGGVIASGAAMVSATMIASVPKRVTWSAAIHVLLLKNSAETSIRASWSVRGSSSIAAIWPSTVPPSVTT